jgi:hypothetical protein
MEPEQDKKIKHLCYHFSPTTRQASKTLVATHGRKTKRDGSEAVPADEERRE